MENTICKNCGKPVERKFCPDCGQAASVGRVNLRTILHEFAHGVVHVDKGILYTVRELTLRPGQAIRNYFDGKRVRLFKPFGYLVLFASIYVFLTHILGQSLADVRLEPVGEDSVEVIKQVDAKIETMVSFLENYLSLISLCCIPLLSLFTFALFRNSKYNYGEHLILITYVSGHQTLLAILLIPLNYIWAFEAVVILLFLSLCMFVYMVAAVFETYKMWKRILYALLVYVIFFICIIVFVVIYLMFDVVIGML